MKRYFFISANVQNTLYEGNVNLTVIGKTFPSKKSIKATIIDMHKSQNRIIIEDNICILNFFEFKSEKDYLNYKEI